MVKLPKNVNIQNLIDELRILSWEASDLLLYYSRLQNKLGNKLNNQEHSDNWDPVTIADINVKDPKKKFFTKSDWLWVLDPLDGTKDFIQGTENYAMQLGLNFKKKVFLGIVLIPEKNELWITDGKKVWGEKKDGTTFGPNLSNIKNLQEMRIVTSENHINKNLENLIEKIRFKKVRAKMLS